MVRSFNPPNRKVFYIETGSNVDLDRVLKEFLESDCDAVEGTVEQARFNIDKSSAQSANDNHGINVLKEITSALKKEKNENQGTQE